MLDIKTRNGKTEIKMCGTISDIASDLSCIIRSLYHSLKEEDEDIAEFFKYLCKDHIMDMVFDDADNEDTYKVSKLDKKESDLKCDECKCDKNKSDETVSEDRQEKMNRLFEEMIKTALGK